MSVTRRKMLIGASAAMVPVTTAAQAEQEAYSPPFAPMAAAHAAFVARWEVAQKNYRAAMKAGLRAKVVNGPQFDFDGYWRHPAVREETAARHALYELRKSIVKANPTTEADCALQAAVLTEIYGSDWHKATDGVRGATALNHALIRQGVGYDERMRRIGADWLRGPFI